MNMEQILEQTLSANIESTLERLLEPIARIERLKRKESEVELVYSLKATTLANKRTKGLGPEFIRDGDKIFYTPQAVKEYLNDKTVRTSGSRPLETHKAHNRSKK